MACKIYLLIIISVASLTGRAQSPHMNAHAHNDYEHTRPLKEALENGFASVEADIHLQKGKLVVTHNLALPNSPSLEALYLKPLDSLMMINNGKVYADYSGTFFLMIDIKTESKSTYQALTELLNQYPKLLCLVESCPLKIFLSGERPIEVMTNEDYKGVGIDGRPDDVGKGYANDLMPVISDTYKNWSKWKGHTKPNNVELQRVRDLATRVHAEGKKLRLWAIPDNQLAWQELLRAGVDLINTDHLQELNMFLKSKGL